MKRSWRDDVVWFIWSANLDCAEWFLGVIVFSPGDTCKFSIHLTVVYVAQVFHSFSFRDINFLFLISSVALACIILSFLSNSFFFLLGNSFCFDWIANVPMSSSTNDPLCLAPHIVLRHLFSIFKLQPLTAPKTPHQHPPDYHYSDIVVESKNMSLLTLIRTKVRTFSWKITYTLSFKGSYFKLSIFE